MASSFSLLLFLLFTTLSLQSHARESQFFSKTSRYASIDEDATALPPLSPESHTGYGLYGRGQFPDATSSSTTKYNYFEDEATGRKASTVPSTKYNYFEDEATGRKTSAVPSTKYNYFEDEATGRKASTEFSSLANTEFSSENYVPSSFTSPQFPRENYGNKGLNENSIPSSFSSTEFPSESYENKELSANKQPSAFTSAEFAGRGYENNELSSNNNNNPSSFTSNEFGGRNYENKELNANDNDPSRFTSTDLGGRNYESMELNANYNPSSFTNAEFEGQNKENIANNMESSRFPNGEFNGGSYVTKGQKQYGMSDTRFLENGKYFYDVNAEGYGKNYEPNGVYSDAYGVRGNSFEYKNGDGGFQNTQESQEEYVP